MYNTDDLDQQVTNCFNDLKEIAKKIKSLDKLRPQQKAGMINEIRNDMNHIGMQKDAIELDKEFFQECVQAKYN